MTWLVWRQHRAAGAMAAGVVAVIAAVLVGEHAAMVSASAQLGIGGCVATGSSSCAQRLQAFASQFSFLTGLGVVWLPVLPALVGVFVGAPLLAREIEDGTQRMVWTQSRTRMRWLTVKVGILLAVSVAGAGVLALLLAWALGPLVSAQELLKTGTRMSAPLFDVEGVVAAGYAAFALALGVALGTVLRRTIPAMVLVVLLFTLVRVPVTMFLRPDFAPPVTATAVPSLTGGDILSTVPAGSWILDSGLMDAAGHRFVALPPCDPTATQVAQIEQCYAVRGYRSYIVYQPVSRYWQFQLTETALYLALTGVLLLVTALVVRWRSA